MRDRDDSIRPAAPEAEVIRQVPIEAKVIRSAEAAEAEVVGPAEAAQGEIDRPAAANVGGGLPSMSTDNTPAGRMLDDPANAGPISLVHVDMRVFDANGNEIGKVDDLRMGDPGAVTAHEPGFTDGATALDEIGRAIFGDGSRLPETVRGNLLRLGYIRIDGKGWLFDTDRYAASNQIARVEGDAVHLTVPGDALPEA